MGGRALSWFLIRLVLVVLAFAGPLSALSVFGLRSLQGDVKMMSIERASLDDLSRRAAVLRAIINLREAVLFNSTLVPRELNSVNRAIAAVDAKPVRRPADAAASSSWARLHNSWNATKNSRSGLSLFRLESAAHDAVVAATDDTEIANERNRTIRTYVNVAFVDAQQLSLEMYRLSDDLIVALRARELTFGERVQGGAALTLMQAINRGIFDNLNNVARNDRPHAAAAGNTLRRLDASTGHFFRHVDTIVTRNGGDRSVQRRELGAYRDEAVAGVDTLVARSQGEVYGIIGGVEQSTRTNLLLTQVGLGILWAVASYVVFTIAKSMKERAREFARNEENEQGRRAEEFRRQNAERALALKTQRFSIIFDRSPIGIGVLDVEGNPTESNPEFRRFIGNSKSSVVAEYMEQFTDVLQSRLPVLQFERAFEGATGDELWGAVTILRYSEGSRQGLCMIQDITQRRQAESRLIYEATHDNLTGLANRKLYRTRLGDILEQPQTRDTTFAAMFIDLDLFKYVNDTFGHPAGDFVLRTVAERLRKLTGPKDLIARFGGDEFAVLVAPPASDDVGDRLAREITRSIAEPIFWEGHQVNIGSSIGLIYGPGPYLHADDMMRNADTAMYAAKSAGRGRYVVFDPAMQEAAHQRAQLSNDLQSALSDPEQIHVLYQPIVSLQDNAVMGFEALARWRHPLFGDIGPDEFVKIAEQSGAIKMLGRSVMRKAFSQLGAAGQRLPDLSRLWLSVNLSPSELSAPDFVESVAEAIRQTDFDPTRLYLEITESRVIDSGEQANRILARLREFGIRVSIDDFGAGYSSLSYLQELDLDLIKIDQGFLKKREDPESRSEILRAIVGLASAFELPVCAEGVETSEQLKLVRSLGFQYAQGRIWGMPMSIEEIEARFTRKGTPARRES